MLWTRSSLRMWYNWFMNIINKLKETLMKAFYESLLFFAKKLCPSSKTIAKATADKAQKDYNGIDQAKRELIARYADKADAFNEYAKKLRQMIADGKIDDLERDQLAEMLEPIIEKAKALVFDK